jgi:hypothetical protein
MHRILEYFADRPTIAVAVGTLVFFGFLVITALSFMSHPH